MSRRVTSSFVSSVYRLLKSFGRFPLKDEFLARWWSFDVEKVDSVPKVISKIVSRAEKTTLWMKLSFGSCWPASLWQCRSVLMKGNDVRVVVNLNRRRRQSANKKSRWRWHHFFFEEWDPFACSGWGRVFVSLRFSLDAWKGSHRCMFQILFMYVLREDNENRIMKKQYKR